MTKKLLVYILICLFAFSAVLTLGAQEKRGVIRFDTFLLEEPANDARQMGKIKRGTNVLVLSYNHGFYFLKVGDQNYYVEENAIQVKQSIEQFSGKGIINSDDVNMRSKDNIYSSIVFVLAANTSVVITEKSGNWYKVDDGKHQGYVHSDYLDISQVDKSEYYVELKMGMSGNLVLKLQDELKALGYFHGKCNGSFGAHTRGAVKRFQRANSLRESGIADYDTQLLLFGQDKAG